MLTLMLTGAGCTAIGAVIGHFQGYLMGSKIRNVTELFTSPGGPEFPETKCVCSHWVSAHTRRGHGPCSAAVGNSGCACEFFVPKPSKSPAPVKRELDL